MESLTARRFWSQSRSDLMALYMPKPQIFRHTNPKLLSTAAAVAASERQGRRNLGFLQRLATLNPLYHSNPLRMAAAITSGASAKSDGVVRSSLIEPDGGDLVELVVPPEDRAARRAETAALPAVRIGRVDLEWVHVVAEGWASPLRGFMREDQYLQSLHFNSIRMADGSMVNMSLPIVLAIDDYAKEAIGASPHVALIGPSGGFVAILRRRIQESLCYR